ncbi:MAG: hypothetical protein LBV41_09765 [Cytophagaceae bacterium]|jgi:hypothetical protein|nr:hypothetical protein [Cytophagaceae bacterium]
MLLNELYSLLAMVTLLPVAYMQGRIVYNGTAGESITIPVNGTSGIYVVRLASDDNKVLLTIVQL